MSWPAARQASALLVRSAMASATALAFTAWSAIAVTWASQPITPTSFKDGCLAMMPASATTGAPGSAPDRFMPVLTSITTRRLRPAALAASASSATFCALSTDTITSVFSGSAINRRTLMSPTIWLAINMSVMPAAASTSASPSLAQVTPIAPAAICFLAISTVLWLLTWGRQSTPATRQAAATCAILASMTSRSTSSAGVSSSDLWLIPRPPGWREDVR